MDLDQKQIEAINDAIQFLKNEQTAIDTGVPFRSEVFANHFAIANNLPSKFKAPIKEASDISTRLTELNSAIQNLNLQPANNSGGGGGGGVATPANPPPSANANNGILDIDDVLTYIEILDRGTDSNGAKIDSPLSQFVLPCPSNLFDMHSVNFEGRDFGTANYLLGAVAGASNRYSVGAAQLGRMAEYGVQRGQYTLGAMNNDYLAETLNIKARAGDDQGYDVYSIAKGVAINPNTELVFRGVNIREFVFNWKLININNTISFQLTQNGSLVGSPITNNIPLLFNSASSIIDLLLDFYYSARSLMYPVVDSAFASGYPAKFAIIVRKNNNKIVANSSTREILVSIGNGRLNRNGEKMGCYIKDLQLDYIPSDSSFGSGRSSYPTVVLQNGSFQEISLSMTVQEAALLNRESIIQSYR